MFTLYMKYYVYSKGSNKYVGDVNFPSSNCNKYTYLGYLGSKRFIYDSKIHYTKEIKNLFDMADTSCDDLFPTQCTAWKQFYDGMNGLSWSECSNNRNNPCACSGVECSDQNITKIDLNSATGISGDISSLSKMTSLVYLNLYSATGISGNCGDISNIITILKYNKHNNQNCYLPKKNTDNTCNECQLLLGI